MGEKDLLKKIKVENQILLVKTTSVKISILSS